MRALHKLLEKTLTKKELSLLPASFDTIGAIAILDVPKELKKKEKKIGKVVLEEFKHITTVATRAGVHTGEFRTRKVRILAGTRTKTTTCRESGVDLRLNVETCYFSPRFGTERLRIASLVKEEETVLVMFSGVGPFPLVISKNASPKSVVGVEKNPACHEFALENKVLNRRAGEKIEFYCGDVNDIVPVIGSKFDRVVMPLPASSFEFVPLAIHVLKKGGWLHVYAFARPEEFNATKEALVTLCKEQKRKCSDLSITKCGEKSPGVFRVCVDTKIV